MAYHVLCTRSLPFDPDWPSIKGRYMQEYHMTLASAVEALLDHQQRGWETCALIPVIADLATQVEVAPVPAAAQLQLTLCLA